MERISYTIEMMKSSWELLKQEKQLVLFPLLSGGCVLLVLLSFLLPLWAVGGLPTFNRFQQQPVLHYGLLFAFYFVNYFTVIFFNSALITCAIQRMRGSEPTLSTEINAALSRLPQIAGWALVSATVGLVLRIIEDRSKWVGQLVAGVLGMAWSVATFFVVPILVVENKGPFEAVRESAALFTKTWGERFVGACGFGLIFFLLAIPGAILVVAGFMALPAMLPLGVMLIAAGTICMIAVGLVSATLQTIFQAAVYLYAREGRAPHGFTEAGLSAAMTRRNAE